MTNGSILLEMESVRKTFPGVVANDDVDLFVRRGEIHGLLGENGAGKSTLMKILYGLYSQDSGDIRLDGRQLDLDSPQDAIENGIGMVHQHFKLIPRLTVAENIVLGEREPAAGLGDGDGLLGKLLDSRVGRAFSLGLADPAERIRTLADEYGLDVDPYAKVWELDIGERQRVEILKALYRDVDLLILDEPTAVLTPNEAERMFETLRQLVDRGLTIIFITHKLTEVKAITDRVTVLRSGEKVTTVDTDAVTRSDLAELMVGREVLFEVETDSVEAGEPVLSATNLRAEDDRGVAALDGVDLTVRSGEIVGVAGVSGNGQRELAECVVGARECTGTIEMNGEDVSGASPRAFVDNGGAFVPEDRHEYGCAAGLSVMHNAIMKLYRTDRFGSGRLLEYDAAREYSEELVAEYDVRGVSDVETVNAGELSGGNLQKLILAREIHRDPDLLVASQPTRGVDVGAIEFLRKTMLDQRESGTGILLLSEDLDEIFDMSDRILVIYEGEIVAETTPEQTTHEEVGLQMTGGAGHPEAVADGGESP